MGGEEVVQEEDLSGEEAGSAGPVKCEVGGAWCQQRGRYWRTNDRAGWRGGFKSLRVNECE
jgi:hypothetical protein